ncbi:hypothetical protein PLICRDRAFT_436969 [Plicaturopsis crispa FD-325 SS-3]|uniref:Uncharacterized protein n=1 Tax=Plicaturopsis crispa FD-325 SS-3 TaxID=944288 RepID=A0A0C9SWH2_PLICR|nr:hypothetical protein PLICRDRAFT_436969 [Plicaturopsis crispa FD-325 SS-3]
MDERASQYYFTPSGVPSTTRDQDVCSMTSSRGLPVFSYASPHLVERFRCAIITAISHRSACAPSSVSGLIGAYYSQLLFLLMLVVVLDCFFERSTQKYGLFRVPCGIFRLAQGYLRLADGTAFRFGDLASALPPYVCILHPVDGLRSQTISDFSEFLSANSFYLRLIARCTRHSNNDARFNHALTLRVENSNTSGCCPTSFTKTSNRCPLILSPICRS